VFSADLLNSGGDPARQGPLHNQGSLPGARALAVKRAPPALPLGVGRMTRYWADAEVSYYEMEGEWNIVDEPVGVFDSVQAAKDACYASGRAT
jgi:hypothetical protein